MTRSSTLLAAAAIAAAAILSLMSLRVEQSADEAHAASCATALCGLVIF
ncbi:MAG TPA: hypothetical protein PLV61_08765 [Parvularculaceae bacterium]|nr:hypothetical protein [Amphiplicatus sp.]HOP21265.1 hypothetical protein [Amphiplicatus sp.]HPE31272.1 hypothetical protein [Parvularculaceae bacterium]HRX39377.1 hypothetical protein [Parvularculaceae bacterium]